MRNFSKTRKNFAKHGIMHTHICTLNLLIRTADLVFLTSQEQWKPLYQHALKFNKQNATAILLSPWNSHENHFTPCERLLIKQTNHIDLCVCKNINQSDPEGQILTLSFAQKWDSSPKYIHTYIHKLLFFLEFKSSYIKANFFERKITNKKRNQHNYTMSL